MSKINFILIISFFFTLSANAFDKYFEQLKGCAAASGYRIIGPGENKAHFKEDVEEETKCDKYDSLVKKAGVELKKEIDLLLKMLEKPVNPLCSELINLRKRFLKSRQILEKISDDALASELKTVKQSGIGLSIQDIHNLLAYKGTMCGANSAIRELSMYVELGNELKSLSYNGAPLIPQQNGDVVESCRNVSVSGGEDLENFFVKVNQLENDDFTIIYNSFYIPDEFIILDGNNVLFTNGCTATEEDIIEKFKYSKSNSKLTVKIIGDCSVPKNQRDYTQNAWTLQIQCNEKISEKDKSECDASVDEYLDQIDVIIEKHDILINTYWSRAMCFIYAHKKLFNDFVLNEETIYFPVSFTNDDKLLNAFLAELKLFEKRKLNGPKKVKVKKIKLAQNLPVRQKELLPNYNKFFMNRFKYCGKRPPEDGDLFKRISFSYCFYGYLRLFDKGHPIYAD